MQVLLSKLTGSHRRSFELLVCSDFGPPTLRSFPRVERAEASGNSVPTSISASPPVAMTEIAQPADRVGDSATRTAGMLLGTRLRETDPIPRAVIDAGPWPFDIETVPAAFLVSSTGILMIRLSSLAADQIAALSRGRWVEFASETDDERLVNASRLLNVGPQSSSGASTTGSPAVLKDDELIGGWAKSDVDLMLDTALWGLGERRGSDAFVVNIGAMDGETFDGTRGYVNVFGWKGLFVEPIPEMFTRLVRSFEGVVGVRFEQAAIATVDGETEMLRMPIQLVDDAIIHPAFAGMATLLPARNGMASEADRAVVQQYGEQVVVPCLTLRTLLAKHHVSHIDLLHIDVEGYDWAVLQQFDFERYRPAIVRLEWTSLDEEEQASARERLEINGYQVARFYDELVGFDRVRSSR